MVVRLLILFIPFDGKKRPPGKRRLLIKDPLQFAFVKLCMANLTLTVHTNPKSNSNPSQRQSRLTTTNQLDKINVVSSARQSAAYSGILTHLVRPWLDLARLWFALIGRLMAVIVIISVDYRKLWGSV